MGGFQINHTTSKHPFLIGYFRYFFSSILILYPVDAFYNCVVDCIYSSGLSNLKYTFMEHNFDLF